MRLTKTNLLAPTIAFLMALGATNAQAADVSNSLVAGKWQQQVHLVGDVYQVVQYTRLTNAVSTTDRLQMPSNAMDNARIVVAGTNTSSGGISASEFLYPSPASFNLDKTSTAVTDGVSVTAALPDVTAASPTAVGALTGSYAGLAVTGGGSIGTNETAEVRVIYSTPKICRWAPNC